MRVSTHGQRGRQIIAALHDDDCNTEKGAEPLEEPAALSSSTPSKLTEKKKKKHGRNDSAGAERLSAPVRARKSTQVQNAKKAVDRMEDVRGEGEGRGGGQSGQRAGR